MFSASSSDRSLAAERVLVDLVPSIGRHRGLFDLGEELREIVELPGRVVLLEERDHLARDVSLVEPVASGGDPGGPPPPGRTALGIDHSFERARQIRQHDRVPGLVGGAVRLQPHPAIVRPRFDELAIRVDRLRRPRPQREAALGVFDRPGRHLLELHRAPSFEHGQRRVQRARNDRGVEADPRHRLAPRDIPVDGCRFRRPALTDHGNDLAAAARIDEHQAFAAKAVQILFDDATHEHGGHARVERVAAFQQRLERGGRRERVPGGHGGIATHHRRVIGGLERQARDRDDETDDERCREATCCSH